MKLLVVVVNYRITELTIDCLRSLVGEVGRVPGTRVAVCENGTGAEAVEQLRRAIDENGWSSWIDLTAIHPNRGFTGGNNVVIRKAMASSDPPEYVLLLNADALAREHALERLVEFMYLHPRCGIAGSQMLWPDGRIQASPFRFQGIASEFDRGLNLGLVSKLLARFAVVPPTPAEATPADWVTGASMILRRSLLEQIGLLDEGLYTYFDDIDICLRARRAGWEVWYVPESRVVHLQGMSTGIVAQSPKRRPAYWFQARRRHFLKNHGALYTALADAAFLVGYALWRLRRRIQGKPDSDPPQMLADSFRHSVFCTGFAVTEVENPALRPAVTPPTPS
jgi:N-acetylglucosaminyl-diphospho-decaprenol L-rhamnosyltransferase